MPEHFECVSLLVTLYFCFCLYVHWHTHTHTHPPTYLCMMRLQPKRLFCEAAATSSHISIPLVLHFAPGSRSANTECCFVSKLSYSNLVFCLLFTWHPKLLSVRVIFSIRWWVCVGGCCCWFARHGERVRARWCACPLIWILVQCIWPALAKLDQIKVRQNFGVKITWIVRHEECTASVPAFYSAFASDIWAREKSKHLCMHSSTYRPRVFN